MSELRQQFVRQQQRLAAQPFGKDPRQDRTIVAGGRSEGLEYDLLAMPAVDGPLLQEPDGTFLFMWGIDPLGGVTAP